MPEFYAVKVREGYDWEYAAAMTHSGDVASGSEISRLKDAIAAAMSEKGFARGSIEFRRYVRLMYRDVAGAKYEKAYRDIGQGFEVIPLDTLLAFRGEYTNRLGRGKSLELKDLRIQDVVDKIISECQGIWESSRP